MSEPDLDALLDDALDDLGTQEEQHKVVKEAEDKRVAQLADELSAAGGGGGGDAELQNLQNMFSTLASALQNPNALESSDGISSLQETLNKTIAQLSLDPNATDEEKAELARCAGLVDNLGKDDKEMSPEDSKRAEEAIAEMMANMGSMRGAGAAGADGAAGGEEGGDGTAPPADLGQLLKMMEEFHKTGAADAAQRTADGAEDGEQDAAAHASLLQALAALKSASPGAGGADAAAAAAAAAAGGEGEPNPDTAAFQIVAQMWSDPAFADPFRAMCAKFPPFLEAKRGVIPADEHARFTAQHNAMLRVVDLLSAGPVVNPNAPAEETAAKFGAISDALEQLQALGAPPPELVQQSSEE